MGTALADAWNSWIQIIFIATFLVNLWHLKVRYNAFNALSQIKDSAST